MSSPTTLAIINQKGGVGKTTTVINLAASLSIMGQNNLVIDLDPQGNATTGLGKNNNDEDKNIYNLLIKKTNIENIIQKTDIKNLDLIGSHVNLSGLEVETANDSNRAFVLKEILSLKKGDLLEKYDNIFIDCPPSLSLLTIMALVASDELLVPLQTEFFALEGITQLIKTIDLSGKKVDEGRLTKIFRYEGTKKVPIEQGVAGDIVIIAGLEKANVADTICDLEINVPINATPIDPPTMSITITVNSSPLAGTEGKKLTSTQIRDRLILEAENNVGINFEENENKDAFVISGRGELMLEILLTQMRREGFEMTVSPPKVLIRKDDLGNKMEPIEEIIMDLDEEFSSRIIDSMNRRKGKLIDLKDTGKNKKRLIFHAPTRGLMGYTSRFLTLTKGTGVINRIFHSYGEYTGDMEGRRNGALISMENGKAVAFAIFNLQARGEMFVTHNDPVYAGMIVGLSSKSGDLEINVLKGKKLTNMRTQGTDENVVLTPVRKMAIAEQLSMLNTDEALEITPKSCRLRKLILDPHERKRQSRAKAS